MNKSTWILMMLEISPQNEAQNKKIKTFLV